MQLTPPVCVEIFIPKKCLKWGLSLSWAAPSERLTREESLHHDKRRVRGKHRHLVAGPLD
jgi:hypothetical protein